MVSLHCKTERNIFQDKTRNAFQPAIAFSRTNLQFK